MNTKAFLENIHKHNNLKLRFTKIIKETLRHTQYDSYLTSLDSFRPNEKGATNLTFRIRLASQDKTMSSDDVTQVIDNLDGVMAEQISASRV